ncbi:MAG: tetratricopeptide repeat protein, partial [Crocinitomicaceae bacterium]|nr:tetratricopeptide repeat protein [Crocinitomicaceae bacterium]
LDFIDHQAADSAYKYLLILEALGSDVKDENLYFLNQNLGLYYNMIEDHTKAIYYYQRAKEVSEKFQMTDSKATILARLSESYRKLKMYTEAELAGVESESISIKNNLVFEERDAVEQLVLLYEANGDFASAYEYQKKLMNVDERINKIEKVQKLKEEEYKTNLALKEKVLAEKELNIQEEQLKSEKAESRNWIMASVILLIIVVLGFTIVIYLRTKKMNQAIELSKIILEQKNKEVTDSINYARQIQEAILAPKKYYQSLFKEIFVFYRPKDIVAGDFYWLHQAENEILFAAADCTGHGVPGAMVSVVCNNALNRSVREYGLNDPGKILDKTREIVIAEFEKSDEEVKDGMDISLVSVSMVPDTSAETGRDLSLQTYRVNWAGANNPLWILRKGS